MEQSEIGVMRQRQTTPLPTYNDQQLNDIKDLFECMPPHLQDGLLCSAVLLVFTRDADSSLKILEELRLVPEKILTDPKQREAVRDLLLKSIDDILVYGRKRRGSSDLNSEDGRGEARNIMCGEGLNRKEFIPKIRLHKLLSFLGVLTTRFGFCLPEQFVENLQELGLIGSISGIASSIQMYSSFKKHDINVVQVAYPYVLHRLVRNPTKNVIVTRTVSAMVQKESGQIDSHQLRHVLRETTLMTGYPKISVMKDIISTPHGMKLVFKMVLKDIKSRFASIHNNWKRRQGNNSSSIGKAN